MTRETPDDQDPKLGPEAAMAVTQMACAIIAGQHSLGPDDAIQMVFAVMRSLDKFVQPEWQGMKYASRE